MRLVIVMNIKIAQYWNASFYLTPHKSIIYWMFTHTETQNSSQWCHVATSFSVIDLFSSPFAGQHVQTRWLVSLTCIHIHAVFLCSATLQWMQAVWMHTNSHWGGTNKPGAETACVWGKSGESAGWQKLTHIHTLTRRHVNRDCVNSRGGEKKEKQQGEPETTPLGSPHRRPAPTCSLWLLTQLHGFTKQGSMAQPLLLHGGQNSLTPFKPNPQSTPELLHNF